MAPLPTQPSPLSSLVVLLFVDRVLSSVCLAPGALGWGWLAGAKVHTSVAGKPTLLMKTLHE